MGAVPGRQRLTWEGPLPRLGGTPIAACWCGGRGSVHGGMRAAPSSDCQALGALAGPIGAPPGMLECKVRRWGRPHLWTGVRLDGRMVWWPGFGQWWFGVPSSPVGASLGTVLGSRDPIGLFGRHARFTRLGEGPPPQAGECLDSRLLVWQSAFSPWWGGGIPLP